MCLITCSGEDGKMNLALRFSLFYTDPSLLSPLCPAGLLVARQALSCLLSLDGSAQTLSLVTVDKVTSMLRLRLIFTFQIRALTLIKVLVCQFDD